MFLTLPGNYADSVSHSHLWLLHLNNSVFSRWSRSNTMTEATVRRNTAPDRTVPHRAQKY